MFLYELFLLNADKSVSFCAKINEYRKYYFHKLYLLNVNKEFLFAMKLSSEFFFYNIQYLKFKRKLYIRIRCSCMDRVPVVSVVREITHRNVHRRLILESNRESANVLFY